MNYKKYIKTLIVYIVLFYTYPSIAGESSGMPQMVIPDFVPQLVWLFIIFPLLYLSMKYVALPRISEIIANRNLKIVNNFDKAEEIKNKIDAANKEHQIAIQETNKQIKSLVNEISQKNIEEAEKKLHECQNNINKIIDEEKIKLENEIKSFNKNIEKISNDAVGEIIEKIYFIKPDKTKVKFAINKFVESYDND
jgi:F-type H+-transporting ATPase subunit b